METIESLLAKPITALKGIGPQKAALFGALGIFTVRDLISHFPRDYEDRSKVVPVSAVAAQGEACAFRGTVSAVSVSPFSRKRVNVVSAIVNDGTGSVKVVWFNQRYVRNSLSAGSDYIFFGKPVPGQRGPEVHNPVFEPDRGSASQKLLRIVPVYPASAGLSQSAIRAAIFEALRLTAGLFAEFMPEATANENELCEINYAYQNVHFPDSDEAFLRARRRFVFQELMLLQLALYTQKSNFRQKARGIRLGHHDSVEAFIQSLPFALTPAQARVIGEIEHDLESGHVLNRLVQGDVGSGKTVVAATAMLKAVRSGCQAAMMAPTEILAQQHFRTLSTLLPDVKIALLTGSAVGKDRRETLDGLRDGTVEIVVGTHAIIQSSVEYKRLGLVVTDEQHRFGVRQRALLASKGEDPHVLVMSATPIPRTLALILYGDLDISVIDGMPPGRKHIETYVVDSVKRERVNNFIRGKVEEERQVYIVCPLIEASEDPGMRAALDVAKEAAETFSGMRVGLLHGKMKSTEKDAVLAEFAAKNIDILVSTTVIEVGIDVPNATLMVIENAERFGLAQLHQLRGRVGRGSEQSYCVLFNDSASEWAKERMATMHATNDGFVISEKDLQIRGPGEFFGSAQHGLPDLCISNLYRDTDILAEAQRAADAIITLDPTLDKPENAGLKANLPKLGDLQL